METCPDCLQLFNEEDFIITECGSALCLECSEEHDCSTCFSSEDESEYEPSEVSNTEESTGDSATYEDVDEEEDP